jgi:hypothetical protein
LLSAGEATLQNHLKNSEKYAQKANPKGLGNEKRIKEITCLILEKFH